MPNIVQSNAEYQLIGVTGHNEQLEFRGLLCSLTWNCEKEFGVAKVGLCNVIFRWFGFIFRI